MSENAFVVVFPSIFAKNKVNQLESNIKKILKIKNQEFRKIKRDDSVIVIDANDPVFASSAINLLFGIKKVAIAKQVKNDFNTIVSEITKIGSNLLLKGEKFYVQVEGFSTGFLTKDIEISATSSIIEKTVKLGAKPGSEEKYDKLLYTYLTKSNAYVCVYVDDGFGGIPYNSQNERVVCAIYDELSAISCLETIKEGFDVKIIVCYKQKSDLTNLVKILNQILPRTTRSKIDVEFFQIPIKGSSSKSLLTLIDSVTEILIRVAKANKINKISLGLSHLIFPSSFVENSIKQVFRNNFTSLIPLSGLDDGIFEDAKELGLGKYLSKIEKLGKMSFSKQYASKVEIKKIVENTLKKRKIVSIVIGPNNVHEILDSLEENH
ncbi:MAG: Thiamine biosynthesis ATP pyrophosphatase-like protein, thiamine biosynthesis protein ThiI [Nitrosopumilales archaeon]|jgi:adenylyl- and sulfurtransferase ThiI|nr:MAG: Thiamine biosynthesis ATP pyrophosphatase-like protein, thiamine biosynthesis protein ThiI [Nitrosopumilales archaeon]